MRGVEVDVKNPTPGEHVQNHSPYGCSYHDAHKKDAPIIPIQDDNYAQVQNQDDLNKLGSVLLLENSNSHMHA